MKKKRSGIKWNKKKQNKNIVLIVIASIAAVATAVFSVLKYRGRKSAPKVHDTSVKAGLSGKTAPVENPEAAKEQIIAHLEHQKITPGELDWEALARQKEIEQIRKGDIPEYMLENTNKKPVRGAKRKRWKKAASGIAMLLAVAVAAYPVMQHLRPAEVMAKESFTGIGKIVEEHGEKNPYKILNIVPSEVYCDAPEITGGGTGSGSATNPDGSAIPKTFSFTTGSMGYLTGGDAPFADDLAEAYMKNPVFRHYESREDFLNLLVPESAVLSFPGVQYKEAYLGVHSVSEADGWRLLFPNQDVTVDDTYNITSGNQADMADGFFRGTFLKYVEGEDKTGYDFVWSKGQKSSTSTNSGSLGRFVYFFNEDNAKFYAITLEEYANMPEGTPAYKASVSSAINALNGPEGYSEEVDIYTYDENDDRYVYQGTVGEVFKDWVDSPDEDNDSNDNNSNNNSSNNNSGNNNSGNDDNSNNDSNEEIITPDPIVDPVIPGVDIQNPDSTPIPDPTTTPDSTLTPDSTTTPDSTLTPDPTTTPNPTLTPDPTTTPNPTPTPDPVALLDASRSAVFTGEWRRLAATTPSGDTPATTPDGITPDGSTLPTTGGTTQTPSGDTTQTPSGDTTQTPSGDITQTPSGDTTQTPSGDTTQTPSGDTTQTPSGDTTQTPSGDTTQTPSGDTTQTPSDDTLQTEEPSGEDAESGTMYYVLSFEQMTDDELAELAGVNDIMTTDYLLDEDLAEAEDGISLYASTLTPDSTFIYVGPGLGNYKLAETGIETDKLIQVYNAPLYFRCRTSNDWLRQYVFSSLTGGDNANSNFRIEVQTVRADEVTSEMVNEADLIYLESGQNMFLNQSLSVRYIQHGETGSVLEDINDMGAGIVGAILERAAEDLTPVIVDYAIVEETDTDKYAGTNYQLLAKALLKRDLAGFYDAMNNDMSGSNLIANLRMNLGNTTDGAANTDFPDKDDNGYNYVNQNIYVINDELLVSDDFAVYFDDFKVKAGFSDVLAAIEAENTTLAEADRIYPAVSKARAIQYIINFSVGIMGEFNDLTILELQPTANIDLTSGAVKSDLYTEEDSKGNTKLVWKTEAMRTGKQILNSKNQFSISTDVKSVVEFNGEWEDINGTYDMVFIGLDGQNLNLSDRKPRGAVYNNRDLNGKVYHLGDESGSGTYDSSDITSQKMMDLLEYLQAGYPIVVENDFFTNGTARGASEETINTKYIAEGTVMYSFLLAAVSGEDYQDSIFTVSDTMANAGFMARMKTSKPRIELVEESADNNSETSQSPGVVQRLVLDENEEYHGRIAFRIKNNRGEDYYGDTATHLYADMNYDGFFAEEEELGEEFGAYVNEGNVIDVTINGMGPGVIPWKLEVADTGNAYRRSSVQGYFELVSAYEEEIRVLQVTTSKGNFFIDLEAMYKKKKDSVLASLLKDAEAKSNLSFEFETVTPAELSENLTKNPDYLKLWDIVVLTVDSGVTVDNNALMSYLSEGRSLLVCSQNKGDNLAGLSVENAAAVLGWTPDLKKTFVSLGAANKYHRYAGLNSGMYGSGRAGWRADKINEGSILYYPYEMTGDSFAFAEKMEESGTGLRASDYLLNFENNLKSEKTEAYVTAWLTFGGSKDTAYGISPKDARNNYYCYSKGNVVYLAQSEYPYIFGEGELAANAMGADECKFFVNALMAAYSAGVHGSDVSIVSGFAQNSAPMKSIAVPFDQEWRDTKDDTTQGILDNTVDVYFKFADSNIGANKKVSVRFFYEDNAGTQEFVIGDRTVMATQFDSEVWTVTDNKLVPVTANDPQNPNTIELIPGKVYRIKAPVVSLRTLTDDKTNDAGIFVLVESEFIRTGKSYKMEGFGTVSLNRARLFLLE